MICWFLDVKQQTNKDGSGKGQMAAWKVFIYPQSSLSVSLFWSSHPLRNSNLTIQAAKIGKEYEAQGGSYTNEAGSKNKPVKGPPQKKSEKEKSAEMNTSKKRDDGEDDETEEEEKKEDENEEGEGDKEEGKEEKKAASQTKSGKKVDGDAGVDGEATEDEEDEEDEKPKPKAKGKGGRPKGSKNSVAKGKKEPREGERKSSRVRAAAKEEGGNETVGDKRKGVDEETEGAKKKSKK